MDKKLQKLKSSDQFEIDIKDIKIIVGKGETILECFELFVDQLNKLDKEDVYILEMDSPKRAINEIVFVFAIYYAPINKCKSMNNPFQAEKGTHDTH